MVVTIIDINIAPFTFFFTRTISNKKHIIPKIICMLVKFPVCKGIGFFVNSTIPISLSAIKIKNKPSPVQNAIFIASGILTFIFLAIIALVTYHNTGSYKNEEEFQ